MEKKDIIRTLRYASPCGELLLGSLGESLCLCDWTGTGSNEAVAQRHKRVVGRVGQLLHADLQNGPSKIIARASCQLDEYFAGKRTAFDLPLLFAGTDFQQTVWHGLQEIPYGTTASYGELAQRIGRPTSVRAVANANGANALSIIVPCHRIIGSNHSLTGYGGGMAAKRWLLNLENKFFIT